MEYFKFNNSRSQKNPFFIYLPDPRGTRWSVDRRDLTPITEEEYTKVKESYDNNEPVPGDRIVVLEFVPLKERYGVLKDIEVNGNTKWARLEDGGSHLLRDVRKESFIHKS